MEEILLLAIFKMCKNNFMKKLAVKRKLNFSAIAFMVNCEDHN